MKQYKWPRPPLLLGFILGPIIERNFQSAVSIHGMINLLSRPLTIALLIIAVVIAVGFSRMGKTRRSGQPLRRGIPSPSCRARAATGLSRRLSPRPDGSP